MKNHLILALMRKCIAIMQDNSGELFILIC
jgi:hypothetical protein